VPFEVLQSSLNFNNNKTTYKDVVRCLGTCLCSIGGLFFLVFAPFILGGHNFLNSIHFLVIFIAPEAPIGGVQFFFGH